MKTELKGIGWGGSNSYITIADVDFLQKYGENTEPEPDKERELLEGFRDYLKTRGVWAWTVEIDNFLSSLRKPAFELICQDGVVTDPEQIVWFFYNDKQHIHDTDAKSAMEKGRQCFISKSAAQNHRLNNTPAIKLSDMTLVNDTYFISKDVAENLVNERIK